MSVTRRPNGRYRARYRDDAGVEHAKDFAKKVDADRWQTLQKASVHSGLHIDPKAGRISLGEYAEQWRTNQVHRDTTKALVESQLRVHLLPHLGSRALASLRRSDVQKWVTERSSHLAPRTVRQLHRLLATILRSAVEDRVIAVSPCVRIALPSIDDFQRMPLGLADVDVLIESVPDRYSALLVLMAGTGLRPGEAFGLTIDRVDFLRRQLRVDQQLVLVSGPPTLAPPKTKASMRTVPLPQVVVEALARHIEAYAPGPSGLLFTASGGGAIRRNVFNTKVWRPTVRRAVLPESTRLHDLRHFYASLLIRHGESVKTVQARLGHASATETLNTYAHLWPDSEDRTRDAVDVAFASRELPQPQRAAVSSR